MVNEQLSLEQQVKNVLSTDRSLKDIIRSFLKELNIEKDITDAVIIETLPLLIMDMKKHPRAFMVHVLGKQWYWFHDLWWDDYKKYTINCEIAARSLGKTTFWTQFLNSYNAFQEKSYEGLICGFNADSSIMFLDNIKREYEENALLKTRAKMERDDKWAAKEIEFHGNNFLFALGINQHLRGNHVNHISMDDIKNDKQTLTDIELRGIFMATVIPMIQRKRGSVSIVGTLFSENDIYHFFKETSKIEKTWNYRRTYVELDIKNKLVYICSEGKDGKTYKKLDTDDIFDYEFLYSIMVTDPDYFAREYLCIVMSKESGLFPKEGYLDKLLHVNEDFEEPIAGAVYIVSGDTARSPKGDYSVFTVLKLCEAPKTLVEGYPTCDYLKIVHIERIQGMITSGQEDVLELLSKKYNNAKIVLEKNMLGQSMIDNLQLRQVRIEEFSTNKFTKPDMIDNLKHFFNPLSPKIVFPYGAMSKDLIDELVYELSHFKRVVNKYGVAELKGVGAHDDMVISLAIGCKYGSTTVGGKMQVYGKKYTNRSKHSSMDDLGFIETQHNVYKSKKGYLSEATLYD